MKTPSKSFLPVFCLILLVAAFLRTWGISFGLPDLFHADEPVVVNHAMYYGTGDLNPHFFKIPPLASYILFLLYGIFFFIGKMIGFFQSSTGFASLFFENPTAFYLIGRFCLGVLPGIASIYLLANWLRDSGWQCAWINLTAFMLAVCFIHVSDSHYIYVDIPLVLISILFFKFLHAADLNQDRAHFKIGLWIGLAAAMKYNGVFLFLPYFWLYFRQKPRFQEMILKFCFSFASAALAFCVLNPYAVLDPVFFINELKAQSAANTGVPFWHHLTYSLAEGLSIPLLCFGVLGMIRVFFSKNPKLESVSIFCLVYYGVLWKTGQAYGRYVLLLTPFLIVLASVALDFLLQKMPKWKLLWVGLIALGAALNLAKDIQFNIIMSKPDIRQEAKDWIEKNISKNSRIALDGSSLSPRLAFSCDSLSEKRVSLQSNSSISSAQVQRLNSKIEKCADRPGYDLYFLSQTPGTNPFLFAQPEVDWQMQTLKEKGIRYVAYVPRGHESELEFKAVLKDAQLIQAWDPYRQPGVNARDQDPEMITGGPFTIKDLLARRANGYRIELYELDLAR